MDGVRQQDAAPGFVVQLAAGEGYRPVGGQDRFIPVFAAGKRLLVGGPAVLHAAEVPAGPGFGHREAQRQRFALRSAFYGAHRKRSVSGGKSYFAGELHRIAGIGASGPHGVQKGTLRHGIGEIGVHQEETAEIVAFEPVFCDIMAVRGAIAGQKQPVCGQDVPEPQILCQTAAAAHGVPDFHQ